MATVTKLPSGKWRVQVRRGGVYKAMTFDRKADAQRWGLDLEAAIARGATVGAIEPPKNMTLADVADAYCAAVGANVATSSALATINRVIGDVAIRGLNAYQLQRFIDARLGDGVQGATIARALSVLSSCLRWVKHVRHIDIDDKVAATARRSLRAAKIKTTSNERDRIITPVELARIYAEIDGGRYILPMRVLIDFALVTGMRLGEITRITHEDLSGRSVFIRARKHPTKKESNDQRVPLTKEALEIIARQPTRVGRIFPVASNSVSSCFGVITTRAKVDDAHFHDLRHAALTEFFRRGLQIQQVQVFSGHANWRELKRYSQITAEDVLAVLEGEG